MEDVKLTFEERAEEVSEYFVFIQTFISGSNNSNLNKILKSNLILMLYNLVESTVGNAVEEIHREIHNNSTSFNALKVNLRKRLVQHLKAHLNASSFVDQIGDIAIDIVKQCFDKQKVFNGNIDSKKIRELAGNYGFDHNTDYQQTKHGQCLLTIKGRRNDLAHGTFSFSEVGKDYTLEDLEAMKDEAINYLREIIGNIEKYLSNKEYLLVQPAAVA